MSSIFILDSHIDIPWEERDSKQEPSLERHREEDFFDTNSGRYFSYEKAQIGGLSAACLAAYIPQGSLHDAGHKQAYERVKSMLKTIYKLHNEHVIVTTQSRMILDAYKSKKLALIPVIENGYALGTDTANLEKLVNQYRIKYITLTHNGHNAIADSANSLGKGEQHGGISQFGRDIIRKMNDLKIIVDVSHASKKTMMQALKYSSYPIIASHSCVHHLAAHPRNLDNEQMKALAKNNGILQITAMPPFLKENGKGDINDLIHHIVYAVDLMGIEHVGFSSDFDGGGGIEGWEDASKTIHVIEALKKVGFNQKEISALSGGNILSLFKKIEND